MIEVEVFECKHGAYVYEDDGMPYCPDCDRAGLCSRIWRRIRFALRLP